MKKAQISPQILPVLCRELHLLTKEGFPPRQALETLLEDEPDQTQRTWLETLLKHMDELEDAEVYTPLAGAMRRSEAFPAYMVDMVTMAEETGNLPETLRSLSVHYDQQLRMSADIRGAVMVPLTLLAVMLAVVILLVTQVLPVFDRVFAQLGVRMGSLATGMMNAGAALARAGTGIGVAVVVLALTGIAVAAVPSLRQRFGLWFRRNFGGRGVLGQLAVARFASAMSMAIDAGLNMDESVDMAGKLCGGARELDEKISKCREEIRAGGDAAEALASCGLFAGRDCGLLKLAAKMGSVPEALRSLSERQEEAGLRRLDQLVGAIEPAIVVITSALAGVILVSVMLPLMSLLSTIG